MTAYCDNKIMRTSPYDLNKTLMPLLCLTELVKKGNVNYCPKCNKEYKLKGDTI